MKPANRPLFSLSILGLGQAATQLLNFAALVVVARVLGREDFGLIQIGVTISAYALLAADAGLLSLGVRDVARLDDADRLRAYVQSQLGLLLVLALAVLGLGLILLPLTPFQAQDPWLFVLYLAFVLPQAGLLEWVTAGRQRLGWTSVYWVGRSAIYALLIFLFLPRLAETTPHARIFVPAFYLVAFVGIDLVLLGPARGLLGGWPRPRLGPWPQWRHRLREAVPFGAALLGMRWVLTMDVFLLGWLSDAGTVGAYAAAVRLLQVLLLGSQVIGRVLLPRVARRWVEDPAGARVDLERALGLLLPVAVLVAVGGWALGPEVVTAIYTAEYADAGRYLRWLAAAHALLATALVLGDALIAVGRQEKWLPRVTTVGVVALGAQLYWIPRAGATAAAICMAAAGATLAVWTAFALPRLRARPFARAALAAGLASALLLLFLHSSAGWAGGLGTWLRVGGGGSLYLGITLALLWRSHLRPAPAGRSAALDR